MNNVEILELSKEEQKKLIVDAHEDSGHSGTNSTLLFLSRTHKWKGMKKDIKGYVESCEICKKYADKTRRKPQRIELSDPFYRVGIDMVGPFPKSEKGNKYIVVVTDHLTRWCEAKAVRNKTAGEIGNFIFKDVICRHGNQHSYLVTKVWNSTIV